MKSSENNQHAPIYLTLIEYMAALFIILDGNSVWHAEFNSAKGFYLLLSSALFSVLLALMCHKKNNKILPIAIITMLCLLYAFLARGTTLSIFLPLFVIGLPSLILFFYSDNQLDLLYKISNIIVVLSLFSILLWVAGPMLKSIQPNEIITIDWGETKTVKGYYNLLFLIQNEDGTYLTNALWRNTSIFTEGPMLSMWLTVALLIELFFRPELSLPRLGILLTALVTTFATTGFIAFILMLAIKYFGFMFFNGKISLWKLCVVAALIIFAIFVVQILMTAKEDTGSYLIRMASYAIAFDLWLKSPILGDGYGNVSDLFMASSSIVNSSTMGFSNSIMAILATGGLWMTIIIVLPFIICLIKSFKFKNLKMLAFSIISTYLIVTTIMFLRFIMVLLVAFTYAYILQGKSIRKK